MTPKTPESKIALKAVNWYVENIYGQDINFNSDQVVEEHFQFVKDHNDITLETYWNDFVYRHNSGVHDDLTIPFINHEKNV